MFLTILIYDFRLGGNLSFMAGLFLWTLEIVSDLLQGRNSLETFFEEKNYKTLKVMKTGQFWTSWKGSNFKWQES